MKLHHGTLMPPRDFRRGLGRGSPFHSLINHLPLSVQARILTVIDWKIHDVKFDAVLHHGDSQELREICRTVAQRSGAIISVHGQSKGETDIALERLLIERSVSVNTAAAGGNASLMTIG